MAVSSAGNSSLDVISASYQSSEKETQQTEDALGRDAFLTMLVAQLQNQDPLNPTDGTEFSTQLAEFSQLEQLMNLNDSIESLDQTLTQSSEDDLLGYVGMQVTGNADTMHVDEGSVSGGFYNLSQPAEVSVIITDANGATIKTLSPGQQEAGSHIISWDGTDASGTAVADGTYYYTVMANSGAGFEQISATVSGTVDGITYNNGNAYLVVQGIVLDPESLTSVTDPGETQESDMAGSAVSCLGRSVSSNAPIVLVEDGIVSGDDLTFEMESQADVSVQIYDAYDQLVRIIDIGASDTAAGSNSTAWDGLSDDGYQVGDGMYYYTVQTENGYATTPVSGEVTAVKNINNSQYLVLGESGRLLALSNITEIY